MNKNARLFAALPSAWLMATLTLCAGSRFSQLDRTSGNFTFLINADPHVNRERPNQKPAHNQMFREFVKEANALSPQPAFVILNGDIYERQAVPDSTNALLQAVKDLKPLPIAVTGNHDVRDFDVDSIFRPVQRALNGTTNDTFAFDCAQWHFVVMPTKELLTTAAKEEAFLKWLDQDLKANRNRPTMAFMHYHLMPVGTSQLEFYTYSIRYKNRLLDTLTRYGNVRYVFSGHVHAGIQNSVKTAWEFKGVNFIVAPSPVRPRPFGEEYPQFTMDGGYYLQVEVRGETAHLRGRQIGRPAEHLYPASFRRFDFAIDPRYFQGVWDQPAGPALRNGDFEQGLEGWSAVFRYQADKDPGYRAAVTSEGASGAKSVCLFVGERGQGWALGEFTEIYQVFRAPGPAPVLKFNYRSGPGTNGGGYVWLAGFKGQEVRSVMVFHWGPQMRAKYTLPRVIDYVVTAGEHGGTRLRSLSQQSQALFWKLPVPGDRWVPVTINLAQALNAAAGKPGQYESLGHDRLIIGLGAWCSDQQGSRSTASFDDVGLISDSESRVMQVNDQPFDATQQGLSLIVSEE